MIGLRCEFLHSFYIVWKLQKDENGEKCQKHVSIIYISSQIFYSLYKVIGGEGKKCANNKMENNQEEINNKSDVPS